MNDEQTVQTSTQAPADALSPPLGVDRKTAPATPGESVSPAIAATEHLDRALAIVDRIEDIVTDARQEHIRREQSDRWAVDARKYMEGE